MYSYWSSVQIFYTANIMSPGSSAEDNGIYMSCKHADPLSQQH